MGSAWPETGLVFTTRTGRPVEPRNFVRSFRRICGENKVRLVKVYHVRHTVGSLLKNLGVPARDAKTILGHTQISTTLETYTDTDEQARREALTRLHRLLGEGQD
jgi:integrase